MSGSLGVSADHHSDFIPDLAQKLVRFLTPRDVVILLGDAPEPSLDASDALSSPSRA